jgi:hypothetical protein
MLDQVPEPDVRTGPGDYPPVEKAGTVGAIAVYMASGPSEHKIEVSPVGDRRKRAHNVVRLRKGGPVPRYVAVFPGLSVGRYTVWRGATKLAGAVIVRTGEVTEVLLPAGQGTGESEGTLAPSLTPMSCRFSGSRQGRGRGLS